MVDKNWIGYKDLWNEVFIFLDINDYFNLELTNKCIRLKVLTYYQLKTRNISSLASNKNHKKIFFRKYYNSFMIFNVNGEFNLLEKLEEIEKEKQEKDSKSSGKRKKSFNSNGSTYNNTEITCSSISKLKENVTSQSVYVDNTHTANYSMENSLFTQQNLVQQIEVKGNRIYVLYHNSDIKVYAMDALGNISFEMKLNFGEIKFKKLVYVKERDSFVMINESGDKLYTFYYPSLEDIINTSDQFSPSLNSIEGIKINLKDIYSISNYLILIDTNDVIYYSHTDNLGTYAFNSDIKFIPLDKPYKNIVKVRASEEACMFIDSTNTVYYVSTNELNKPGTVNRSPKPLSEFNVKNLAEISCGEHHSLLLERVEMQPLEKWTSEDVQGWFREMNLSEYVNIVKYEKINGRDISQGDETFFINVMGMQDEDMKKVKYEISNVKDTSCKSSKLWGWGSNKFGQLGQLNYSNDYLKTPKEINLPDLSNANDFISEIFCGKKFSLLLTKFGEIFITGNYRVKDKENVIPTNTTSLSAGKKNKYVDRTKNSIATQFPKHRWVNITKKICFTPFKHYEGSSTFFRIKTISIIENTIFLFGYKSHEIPFTLQESRPKLKHLKKGDKFITSNGVLEQILNKRKHLMEQVSIVYSDALLKLLEVSLENYQKSEVPYHKIQQIKLYGNIIWDRKKRFYKDDFLN